MKHNKIIVILMAIALLIGTFISAAAAGRYAIPLNGDEETVTPPQEAPVIPHVGVTGLLVGTEYFELSLKISAREFQTVGVVLSYNAEALTPIVWSSGEKNEDGTPKAISMDPASNNSWNRPVVLPSRGTDGLAGKPALSYLGYDQEQQRQTGRGYLYLGADTLQYGDLIGERVVTVRFRREAGTEITMPEDPETDDVMDEKFTVCLASEPISLEAIPGHPLLLTAQGENRLPRSYINYRHIRAADIAAAAEGEAETGSADEPAPIPEFDCTLSFSFGDVESADSMGGSGDYAITFFDWDGRVIDAIAAPENAEEAVEKWQTSPTIDARLTNKTGYTFDKWLVVHENNDGEGLHTAYGSLTSRNSSKSLTDTRDIADFSNLSNCVSQPATEETESKSVLVQATYVANSDVNGGQGDADDEIEDISGTPDGRYSFDATPKYYQYGGSDSKSGQYGITVTVRRNSASRADLPTVYAKVYAGAEYVTERIELENTDVTTFELVVPRATSRVTYQLVDAYGEANWLNGASRSGEAFKDQAEILFESSFPFLMDAAVSAAKNGLAGDWTSDTFARDVTAQCFKDAGYTGVNDNNIADARKKLVDAVNANGGAILDVTKANNALQGYGARRTS